MPRRSLKQSSFFDPEFVCPSCLEEGTVPWLLARFRSKLFPEWLFEGWRGEGRRGRKAWPPEVLMTLILLRFGGEEISRRGSCRRARTDAKWRAAMGLNFDVAPPDEKTVRNFEKFLRGRHAEAGARRIVLFHEHVVRLCKSAQILEDHAIWVTDSTPMWCYGAVKDTVELLAEGMARVARQWAEGTRQPVDKMAAKWGLDWMSAPSIKGTFEIDWKQADQRSALITRLGEKAVEMVEEVRIRLQEVRRGKRKKLLKLCRRLMQVVEQDLEADEEGGLQIAQGVAEDRLISLTDPQARHGRKSDARKFNGFKLHVLGDAVSGLIVSLAVTSGNVHDGQPASRLIRRAKSLCESMDVLLGDTAYGAAQLREQVAKRCGVRIVAPPAAVAESQGLGKESFEVDIEAGKAWCPNNILSEEMAFVSYGTAGRKGPRFLWPKEVCNQCPLSDACKARKKHGRSRMVFHPNEQTLRDIRAEWEQPEIREMYRQRSQGERLINESVRRGAREAMAWGMGSAELQAYAIASNNNLSLLAEALARDETPDIFASAA
jgi:hypothetical protein